MTITTHPAELARASLRRIAELRLLPTPENFARFYVEAGGSIETPGVAAPTRSAQESGGPDISEELLSRFDRLVDSAVETTSALNEGLAAGGDRSASNLEAPIPEDPAQAELLNDVADTTRAIHEIVRASHAELLETQRGLAAIKAELAESRRLLSQDPLTGSENRRGMEGILAREIAAARRTQEPLALAMIDIDHFKQINDTHGHAVGDAALIHLTQAAKALLRGNDAFVRYGGDEFVLVLPDTDVKGALIAGERLRAMLARQPLLVDHKKIALTLSGGVASFRPDEDDAAALLARADAALYEAKREGRDQIRAG